MEEHLVYGVAFVFQNTGNTRNTGVAQNAQTLSGNERVWIQTADNDTGNFVFENRIGARRGASPVAAWLQRHINGSAGAVFRAVFECVALCVQTANVLVPALADDAVVLDDDRADHRVGRDVSGAALGKLQRMAHIVQVALRDFRHFYQLQNKKPRLKCIKQGAQNKKSLFTHVRETGQNKQETL